MKKKIIKVKNIQKKVKKTRMKEIKKKTSLLLHPVTSLLHFLKSIFRYITYTKSEKIQKYDQIIEEIPLVEIDEEIAIMEEVFHNHPLPVLIVEPGVNGINIF